MKKSPSDYTRIDDSQDPQHWIDFMLDWATLPSIVAQRQQLTGHMKQYKNASILLAGCGAGDVIPGLLTCLEQDGKLTAVDLSLAMLNYAKKNHQDKRLIFQQADLTVLPFEDNSFDTIWVERVLHHIPDATQALAELSRCCKTGGCLIIAEPFIPSTVITQLSTEQNNQFAKAWSDTVANGTVGARLYHHLQDLNLTIDALFLSHVFINKYTRISRFVDFLSILAKGNWSKDELVKQSDKWIQADKEQQFFLSWPMYNYVLHKS